MAIIAIRFQTTMMVSVIFQYDANIHVWSYLRVSDKHYSGLTIMHKLLYFGLTKGVYQLLDFGRPVLVK
jgi:hypothetical protein